MAAPIRTCLICRGKGEKAEMLRFALCRQGETEQRLVLDLANCEPGRGVYSHRGFGCLFQERLPEMAQISLRRSGKAGKAQKGQNCLSFEEVLRDTETMLREGKMASSKLSDRLLKIVAELRNELGEFRNLGKNKLIGKKKPIRL